MIGTNIYNVINKGTWNVILDGNRSNADYYGMGSNIDGLMMANINFIKADNADRLVLTNFYIYGKAYNNGRSSCSATNYVDFNIPFEMKYINNCSIFTGADYGTNFGNISVDAISIGGLYVNNTGTLYNGYIGSCNFGDININAGYITNFYVNTNRNYGNITVNYDADRIGTWSTSYSDSTDKDVYPSSRSRICAQYINNSNTSRSDSVFNAGDITVNLINFNSPRNHNSAHRGLEIWGSSGYTNYGNINVIGKETESTPFEGYGEILIFGAGSASYGNINAKDVALKSSSTINIYSLYVINSYGQREYDENDEVIDIYKQNGSISVDNCKVLNMNVFGSYIAVSKTSSYGHYYNSNFDINSDIEIKDSSIQKLYLVGGVYAQYNLPKSVAVNTNIKVSNISNTGMSNVTDAGLHVYGAIYYPNLVFDNDRTANASGSISVEDISAYSKNIEILPFGHGVANKWTSDIDTTVNNCNISGDLLIRNIFPTGNNKNLPSINVVNSGNTIVLNSNCNNMYIAGIGNTIASTNKPLLVNTGDITINDVDIVNKCNIAGIALSMISNSGQNSLNNIEAHNLGNITYNDDSFNSIEFKLAGVCIDMNEADGIYSNGGIISVDIDDTNISSNSLVPFRVSGIGISSNNYASGMINANNISVNTKNSDKLDIYVSGIMSNGNSMGTAINYGNLDVNADYTNNASTVHISPTYCGIKDFYTWINYGDVNFETNMLDTTKHFAYASTARDISQFAINYGNFNYAKVDDSLDNTMQWVVDMSGNKEVVPNRAWIYYAGSHVENEDYNIWWKEHDYNDLAFKNGSSYLDLNIIGISYLAGDFKYNYMFDPSFGFTYCNPISVKYTKANLKTSYYADNLLINCDYSVANGLTKRSIDKFAQEHDIQTIVDTKGLYIVGSTLYSTNSSTLNPKYGYEFTTALTSSNKTLPISYNFNDITCTKFEDYISALHQTRFDYGGEAKIVNGITLKSTNKYDTDTGSTYINSKSSLIKFQAPIDGDKDRNYSENTLVSVIDVYIPINGFNEEQLSESIEFLMNFEDSSYGSTFHSLKRPIRFDTYDNCVNYLESVLAGEYNTISNTLVLNPLSYSEDGTIENKVSLILPSSIDDTVSYLIGVNKARDTIKENAIVLNLHLANDNPSAHPIYFKYPTGISSSGTSLTYTTLMEDRNFDNYKEAGENYTVDLNTVSNSEFASYEYPVYKLTKNMYHTTDGKYNKTISNTGNVEIKFETENVSDCVVYLSTKKLNFDSATGLSSTEYPILFNEYTMDPSISTSSEDGVRTVYKYQSDDSARDPLYVSSNSMKLLKQNNLNIVDSSKTHTNSISLNNNQLNTFLCGGYKYIIVGTILDSDEFMPLFAIDIYKDRSDENYIIDSSFERHDILTKDGSTTKTTTVNTLSPGWWDTAGYYTTNTTVSALSSFIPRYPSINYGSRYNSSNGLTSYPTNITYNFSVESETYEQADYKDIVTIIELDKAPLSSYRSTKGYASGFSQTNTTSDKLFIMDENVSAINLQAYYSNVQFRNVIRNNTYYATIDDVYVKCNGRNIGYVEDNNDGTFTWSYVANGQVNKLKFSINSGNIFYIDQVDSFNREILSGKVITITPIISLADSVNCTLELDSVSIAVDLIDDNRLVAAKCSSCLFIPSISTDYDTVNNDSIVTNDVSIDRNGVINYENTAENINHFYITNCVNYDTTSNTITLTIPRYSTLEWKDGDTWKVIGTNNTNNNKDILKEFTYDSTTLQSTGYKHLFRIKAQSYLNSKPDENISYYDFIINATARNKTISIQFAQDDATTMALYNEIISNTGNTAIQIKNMNADHCELQQTKIYTSTNNMDSTFYKLTQGDFAIDVKVPEGYTYKVKIDGGSSEGYLQDNAYVKGKKLLLPYKNEQTIRLKVYLEAIDTSEYWGVVYNKSFFKQERLNKI
jgi:hypothetical protein